MEHDISKKKRESGRMVFPGVAEWEDHEYRTRGYGTAMGLDARRRKCGDCGNMFGEDQGRPYKYEKAVWLCDDCHDARMDDN